MKLHITAAFAALALAACGGAETPATDGAAPETAAMEPAAAPAPAAPAALLGPAAGEWEFASKMGDMALPAARQCITEQLTLADAQAKQQAAGLACDGYNFQPDGAKVSGTYTCTDETGAKMSIQMALEGDVNTAYTSTMVTTRDPAPPGMPNPFTMTINAKRLGDCPPPAP